MGHQIIRTIHPKKLFNQPKKNLLKLSFLTLLFLSVVTYASAQTVVNGTAGNTNNLEIVQIVYEVNGTFYTQNTSGSDANLTFPDPGPNDGTAPRVNLYRIRYTDGTDNFDVFPTAKIPTVTNFNSNVGDPAIPEEDISVIKPTEVVFHLDGGSYNTPAYPDAIEEVVSIPDIRSYWDVQTDALGSGGDDFIDVVFTDPVFSDDRIIITERFGNTTMSFQALDDSQNPIGNAVEISGGTGTSDLYDWDTTIHSPFDDQSNGTSDTQAQWMIMFEASQFGVGSDPIYGYRVTMLTNNGGDGKILLFEDPGTLLLEGECWRMLSSTPFQGITYADILDPIWTQGVDGANYEGAESNVLLWDNSSADNSTSGWTTDYYDDTPLDLENDVVPAGTGFMVGVYADDDYNGPEPPGFPKEISVSGTETSGPVSPAMNSNPNGWTLVGNPFGAPIDFSAVSKTNLTDVAYVYDRDYSGPDPGPTNGNVGGWRTTDGNYGDILNGLIAPFQGMFVQNNGTIPSSITFDNDDKSAATFDAPNDEWEFYGKEKQQNKKENYARLEVQGEGLYDSAWFTFSNRGSLERMKGDAYELKPFSEHHALLSTRKADELFDIGHFPNLPETEIPVNLETTLQGTFTISVSESDIPLGTELVFVDKEENVTIPFNESFEYEFTTNQAAKANPDPLSCKAKGEDLASKFRPEKAKSSGSDRFVIKHASNVTTPTDQPSKVQLNQNYPNPFNPTTQITYELPQQSEVLLEVYDLTGRLITTLVNESVSEGIHNVTFDARNLTSGVYIYRLQTGSRTLSRKLTVIK